MKKKKNAFKEASLTEAAKVGEALDHPILQNIMRAFGSDPKKVKQFHNTLVKQIKKMDK